jgi:type IV pilus assembly protein PilC
MLPTLLGPKPRDLIAFARELTTLLEAGIPFLPAVRLLRDQTGNRMFCDALRRVVQDVETGVMFSEACSKHPLVFPELFRRLVAVGEETGEIQPMLKRLVAYMERREAMLSRVRRSLAYPALTLAIGLVAVFVLLTFSLPALTGLFKEYGADLTLTTRILVLLGGLSKAYGGYAGIAVVLVAILAWWYAHTPVGARQWDYLVIRMPVAGETVVRSNMATLASTTSTLLSAGINLTDALDVVTRSTHNAVVRNSLVKVKTSVLTGSSLSVALTEHPVFPRLFAQMVGVGEETGTLERNLEALAAFYEQETEKSVSTLTGMIEPLLILMVGLGVGFIAVSIMSALYGLLQHIK